MKWFSKKYTYPLIFLSLILSTGLQFVWLQQLFIAQKRQLEGEIESVVSNTAKTNIYEDVSKKDRKNVRFNEFFLSPGWLQMWEAFEGIKQNNMTRSLSYSSDKDSSYISLRFSFEKRPSWKDKKGVYVENGETPAQRIKNDSLSLKKMSREIEINLKKIGLSAKTYYAVSDYNNYQLKTKNLPVNESVAYSSKQYSYNMEHLHKYQLLVPSIHGFIWYRMRYYLISSFLMIVLTSTAFYFILRLMRNQRLYADARIAFTSNMTHELKTPIATVSVALESITKYKLINDPEKLQNYLDISRQELERLNFMVEKVLSLSQENETDRPYHQELYDVQSGLKQVINSMKLQLLNSHAVINLIPSAEPCFVYGDPLHLTNIFYNLIDNAIKYSKDNLILQISCISHNGRVILSFKDNGPGIDQLYQHKVFERFFRVPAKGDIHDIKGSGLGLNYVKNRVEKHDGRITLKSEPGKGSNFIIDLPAAT